MAVETNGTLPLPENVDWITLSPKEAFVEYAKVVLTHADELKVVFDGEHDPEYYISKFTIHNSNFFLQPMDTGDSERNKIIMAQTVDYIKRHPQWRLSLQIHKILNIQ